MKKITVLLTTSLCLLGLANVSLAAHSLRPSEQGALNLLLGDDTGKRGRIQFDMINNTDYTIRYGYQTSKQTQGDSQMVCFSDILDPHMSIQKQYDSFDYSPDKQACRGVNQQMVVIVDDPRSEFSSTILPIDIRDRVEKGTCKQYDISVVTGEDNKLKLTTTPPVDCTPI